MKSDRRHELLTNTLARELEGVPFFIKQYWMTGVTILSIVVLLITAIRFRMVSAQQLAQRMAYDLANAREEVDKFHNPMMLQESPKGLAYMRDSISHNTEAALTDLLNNTTDPKLRAEALVIRGDLNWHLANLPALPGAATQPALQFSQDSDALLKKSQDAYEQILHSDTLQQDHAALISARFGLAAIAENRGQWDTAHNQFEAIENDEAAEQSLRDQASIQKGELPQASSPLMLATPNAEPSLDLQSLQPILSNLSHSAASQSTAPTARPATVQPSTAPAAPPAH